MGGLFVDAWTHVNLGLQESAFTASHAGLYTGFAAVSVWMLHLVDRREGRAWRDAVPVGHGTALAGVALVLFSAIIDLVWHSVVGFEQRRDALLSPTHLLLFTGATLMLTAPVTSAIDRFPGRDIRFRSLLAPSITLMLVTALWTMDLAYLSIVKHRLPTSPDEQEQALTVARMLISSLLLTAPPIFLRRRWNVPFGVSILLFGGVALLIGATNEFDQPRSVAAAIVTGLVLELIEWRSRSVRSGRRLRLVLAAATPIVFAGSYVAIHTLGSPSGWSSSALVGSVMLCGLVGWALGVLVETRAVDRRREDLG
jgi:hypothetical protein